MQRTGFRIKSLDELTALDFDEAPLWVGYYEPDDVEGIIRWGVPEPTIRAALDAAGWEDDHYFPLPVEAAQSEWMRGKLFGATVTTAGGTRLSGYVGETRSYVVAFSAGERFVLSSDTPAEQRRLSTTIGEKTLLPLRVVNRVTAETWSFPAG